MSEPPNLKRYWLLFGLHVLLVGAMLYFSAGNAGIRFVLAWTMAIGLGMVAMHHFAVASVHLFIAAISRHPRFPRNPEIDQAIKRSEYALGYGFLWALFFATLSIVAAWLLFP
jgi:hypothetical protein